jgi:hypothetical protein
MNLAAQTFQHFIQFSKNVSFTFSPMRAVLFFIIVEKLSTMLTQCSVQRRQNVICR